MTDLKLEHDELTSTSAFNDSKTKNASEVSKEEPDYSRAAPAGEETYCSGSFFNLNLMEKLQPIEEQLKFLLRKADEFQARLIHSQDQTQNEACAHALTMFLRMCHPYFTYLESTARNTSANQSALPLYIRTLLLQISQQLCSRLEQLVLLHASFGYISLEEEDPLCISHFYIGQCQVENIKLSMFRYCLPSPFVPLTNSCLYKRMRWNLEWERRPEAKGEEETNSNKTKRGLEEMKETWMDSNSTEYYFLCCEDVRMVVRDEDAAKEKTERSLEEEAVVRMWSIGQWVQTYPDPHSEDIYDWVLCTVPQGQYRQLVYLGEEEPLSCIATDCLLAVLLSQVETTIIHTTT